MRHEFISLKKAIVAGFLIGIGCTVYLVMENKIVASFLFGLGLFTIINFKLNLFTGKIGYLSKETYKEILITLLGNFLGINSAAMLIKQTRIAEKVMTAAAPVVETKLNDSYLSLFILAIFCGMLMFTAVATFKLQPNILGTIAVFLCVSVFIMAGFEHCIANMYYFGIMCTLDEYILPLIVMILGNSTGGIVLYHLTKDVNK